MIQAVEFLVSRGHNFFDIKNNYTYDQIMSFYESGIINNRQEIVSYAQAMRAAYHAKHRDFVSFMRDMSATKKEVEKQITPAGLRQLAGVLGGR